ncbi:hypothetical protein ACI68E_004290 [Malassezia pachydermatis]
MASVSLPLPLVSPLATHVLELCGFSPVLTTQDLHAILAPWSEGDYMAYRIKWHNDTTAYIMFQDAGTAKHAYLSLLCTPPAMLRSDYQGNEEEKQYALDTKPCSRLCDTSYAQIRPYFGPEAAALLANSGMITRGAAPIPSKTATSIATQKESAPSRSHRRIMSGTSVPSKGSDALSFRSPKEPSRHGGGTRSVSHVGLPDTPSSRSNRSTRT